MEIIYSDTAQEDLVFWKRSGDTASQKKISALIADIEKHPTTGIGRPERLTENLSGMWSRRINLKDRIIDDIDERKGEVFVYTLKGHYNDK